MKSAREPIADRTPLFSLSDLEANETPLRKKKERGGGEKNPPAFILASVSDGEGGLNMTMENCLHHQVWGEGILALGKEIPSMHCPGEAE